MGMVPVEDMQALSITTLSASEVEQQYELIGPLGKGTYGRVDLVAHRTQGEHYKLLHASFQFTIRVIGILIFFCE